MRLHGHIICCHVEAYHLQSGHGYLHRGTMLDSFLSWPQHRTADMPFILTAASTPPILLYANLCLTTAHDSSKSLHHTIVIVTSVCILRSLPHTLQETGHYMDHRTSVSRHRNPTGRLCSCIQLAGCALVTVCSCNTSCTP